MMRRRNVEQMGEVGSGTPASGPGAARERSATDPQGGVALLVSLIVLSALTAGALGIFLASRAEVRIGSSHAASVVAFHAAEGGLATWLAGPVQPGRITYDVGRASVGVEARRLLVVDSLTRIYLVSARARWPAGRAEDGALAVREITVLGRRVGLGLVERVSGSWRETF